MLERLPNIREAPDLIPSIEKKPTKKKNRTRNKQKPELQGKSSLAEMYFMWNRSPRGVRKTKRTVEPCDCLKPMIGGFLQTCSKAKTNESGPQTRTGA